MVTVVTGCNDSTWHCMMLDKMVASLKQTNPNIPVEVIRFSGDKVAATHAKPLAVLQVQGSTRGDVVWLDCDMLVRKSLGNMDTFSANGLYVLHRRTLPDTFKFNVGFVGLGYSYATSQLIRRWISETDADESFFADQIGLWRAYDAMKDAISLFPLHETFNDCHFRGQSHIWHAKGNSFRKHANEHVLKEWGCNGIDKMRD